MAREFNNTPTTYLRVNKDGLLYEKSKEPKEGFNEVKLKNGSSTYHKTYGGTDDGYLSYIGIKELTFDGGTKKLLEVAIKGENGTDKISFDLFKQNGALDDYIKNLAILLPNLDFGERINIVPSRKKNDRGYAVRSLFINYPDKEGDDNYVKFAHMYGDDGDIPPAKPTKKIDGSISYDFTEQDTYLYNILKEQIERFKEFKGYSSDESNVETQNESAVKEPVSAGIPDEDDDDLPF